MSNPASRIRTTTQRTLAEHANVIRTLNKRTIGDTVEIGKHLIAAKKLIGHGGWLAWIDREFGWSERTAQRYIEFAEAVGKCAKLADLNVPISGLYLLAAHSTPAELIEAIAERTEQGERLSLAEVKRMIAEAEARDDDDEAGGVNAEDTVEDAPQPKRIAFETTVQVAPVRQVAFEVTYERETVAVPYYVPRDEPAPRTIEDFQRDRIRARADAIVRHLECIARDLDEHREDIGAVIKALTDEERDQARGVVDELKAALDRDNVVKFPDRPN